jgi:D-alanyl-lipoteichoic acid acyltransferase DltB (MBOAT superfamily)
LLSINDLTGRGDFKPLNIVLPVGISFYTFSAISYVVDCYQKKLEPTTDIAAGLLYTSFFPAILSGPIHKATEQLPQYLKKREFDYGLVNQGFKDYVWGAFMKLCVADRLGMYVDAVYGNIPNHSGTTMLVASVAYTLQIYADFAGYSLMAIGCGKMLGIKLQNNFNLPYFAKTITEFWSKWHMSLTGWFKNYLYIPLGGNRVSKGRWIFNIMVVFLLSGLWHGAAYTFIIWGAIHGVAQVIEKLIYGKKIKQIDNKFSFANVLRVLLTFAIVNFAWIFFRLPNMHDVFDVIEKMFMDHGGLFTDSTLFIASIALVILFAKDATEQFNGKLKLFNSKYAVIRYLSVAFLICFILLTGVLEGGQFIYFQF